MIRVFFLFFIFYFYGDYESEAMEFGHDFNWLGIVLSDF